MRAPGCAGGEAAGEGAGGSRCVGGLVGKANEEETKQVRINGIRTSLSSASSQPTLCGKAHLPGDTDGCQEEEPRGRR